MHFGESEGYYEVFEAVDTVLTPSPTHGFLERSYGGCLAVAVRAESWCSNVAIGNYCDDGTRKIVQVVILSYRLLVFYSNDSFTHSS